MSGTARGAVREGLMFLWRHALVRDTTFANLALSIGNGAFFAQLVVWVDTRFHAHGGDLALGLFFTAVSVGAVLGSLAAEWIPERAAPRLTVGGGCLLAAGSGWAALWSPTAPLAMAFLAAWQAATVSSVLLGVSLRQRVTPDELVGRVSTTGRMLALGIGFPVGALTAAGIAHATGSAAIGVSVAPVAVLLVVPIMLVRQWTSPQASVAAH